MAKRFAYVSFGILCLVAAYQVGAKDVRAEWNAESPGQLVGMVSNGSTIRVYTRSGSAWQATNDDGWIGQTAWADLPVPAEEIALLDEWTIITMDDVLWVHQSDHWVNHGQFPGAPVTVESHSFGGVKARFR